MATLSKPGDKPAGLIHIVIFTAEGEQRVAAFTDRGMAEAFESSRTATSPECKILETVVDGQAAGVPTGD